jgi:hypothetical protein
VSVEGKTLGGEEEKAFTTDDWGKCQCNPLGKKKSIQHQLLGKDEKTFAHPLLGKDENAFTKAFTAESIFLPFDSYGADLNRKCNKALVLK